jgi:hypothetical protein
MAEYDPHEPDPAPGNFEPDFLKMVTPLRLVFWGGILCLIDVTVNGFDLLNDVLGMLLITIGVFRLGAIPVARSNARGMTFVKLVAVLSTLLTFLNQFTFVKPPPLAFVWATFGLVELAATIVFCAAMRRVCGVSGLAGPAASWKTTTVLFVVLHALPLGCLYVAVLIAVLAGTSFHTKLGPEALLVLIPLFIPLIHFFVSTSRMRRAALKAAAASVGMSA